ncbi:MAG: hypothetical protein IKX61_03745 [Prevotella sp.]|nr:hypothetical protein [Prevotella sp.]
MEYRDFFSTEEFRSLLRQYEEAESSDCLSLLSSDDLTDIAEYYHYKGNFDKAIEVVDCAIELYPGALGPLVFRARAALMKDEDASQALYYAEQIDDKEDLDYYYIRAEIMIAQFQASEANEYLLDKYDIVDEDEQQDFVLDVATLFADYEYWDLADSWACNYDHHDTPDYQELQGRLCTARGQYADAEKIFNALLDNNSFSIVYWNQLALAQLYGGKISESLHSCDFALAINPNDSDALLTKANGLYMLCNYEGAANSYIKYMKSCGQEIPDDFDISEYIKKND